MMAREGPLARRRLRSRSRPSSRHLVEAAVAAVGLEGQAVLVQEVVQDQELVRDQVQELAPDL